MFHTKPIPTKVVRGDVLLGRGGPGCGEAFPGNISELLLYKRAVSVAERIEIERYLSDKWN